MNSNKESFIFTRIILAILGGSIASIVLMFWIRNYLLASVLGMLVAIMIADHLQPKRTALLGLIVGCLASLFWGWRNYRLTVQAGVDSFDPALILAMLTGLLLSGLICAVYGWIIGKLLTLYKQGCGPFF